MGCSLLKRGSLPYSFCWGDGADVSLQLPRKAYYKTLMAKHFEMGKTISS